MYLEQSICHLKKFRKRWKFKKENLELKVFKNINKDNSKDIINMCGSGVTACHNFLAMEYCGLKRSRIYVGSWSAWSSYR
jgi:thiosulfate/3-mercaptopyruvate sulfurtransferase